MFLTLRIPLLAGASAGGTVRHSDAWSYYIQSRPLFQSSIVRSLASLKSETPGGFYLSYDNDETGKRQSRSVQSQDVVDGINLDSDSLQVE